MTKWFRSKNYLRYIINYSLINCSYGNQLIMGMFSAVVPNAIIRRRIMFALSFLPKEYPLYWDMVLKFVTANSPEAIKAKLTEEDVKRKLSLIIKNLKRIYPTAFTYATEQTKQLIHMERPDGGEVGVILISDKGICSQCHSALALRSVIAQVMLQFTQKHWVL